MLKILSFVSVLIFSAIAHAEEPDLKCVTYTDSQVEVELSVQNYVGTLTSVSFDGTRDPHGLGGSYLVEDVVTKQNDYHFVGGAGEFKDIVLNYWPEQALSVETAMSATQISGFKGEVVYSNSVRSAAVCNWL